METLTDPAATPAATPVEEPTQVESPSVPVVTPEPVEGEPEPVSEPVRGRITLVTGREHEVESVEEVEAAENAGPDAWVTFNRPNGTPLKVRVSAIISSE